MTELQEQYRLLEVSADVSFATLKQAYKDLVLVWHPDRFSDHPRLQKKAEEKLKCINLAFQEISAAHRGEQKNGDPSGDRPPNSSSRTQRTQTRAQYAEQQSERQHSEQQSEQQRAPKDPSNRQRYRAKTHARTSQRQTAQPCHNHSSGISLAQARFVIHHFQFRPVQRPSNPCLHFKSGPFKLDLNPKENWLSLANLCDSINGFHPILLAIPCKASRLFVGAEAKELIALFWQAQHR